MDAVSLIKEILRFWFVECEQKQWWVKDPEFDSAVRERFGDLVVEAAAGKLDHWAESAEGARALIILLDQFTRNIYRGSAKAFEADEKARTIARSAIARGFDKGLNSHERNFMYLPLEHSEDLSDQEECCRLVGAIGSEGYLKFAQSHKAIIERFGRFPHRNATLGRANTPEEEDYLKDPKAGF